jgi:hypothetical protein
MTHAQGSPDFLNDAVSKLRVEAAIWKQQALIVAIRLPHHHHQYFKELIMLRQSLLFHALIRRCV